MENLRSEEEQHNDEGDDVQKETHASPILADDERKELEDVHNNKITQLELEKKSLTQTKEEIEKKIIALQNQKSKEEEEFKKKQKLTQLAKEVEEGNNTLWLILSVQISLYAGEKDNETILKINDFLEQQKKLSKISKNLYMHVKGNKADYINEVHHLACKIW